MKHTIGIGFCLAVPLFTGHSVMASDQDSVDDLRAEIASLRSTVTSLESRIPQDNWMSEQRAEEIRSLVHDVMADADTRASLLGSGMTAGYDGGFIIGSDDGNFKLKMNGQIQVRYVLSSQNNGPTDNTRAGFENRRTKLKWKGHVVDPSWTFGITGAFSNSSGSFGLEDSWIAHKFDNGWKVKLGQFKLPFLREELISSSKQLMIERSLVNERFNQDFSQGIEGSWHDDQWSFKLAYSDGFKSRNSRPTTDERNEYAFTARVEYLAIGDSWKPFKDFTSKVGADSSLMLGAAFNTEKDSFGTTTANPKVERNSWTVDASYEADGLSAYAALVGRSTDTGLATTDELGFVIQGGFYLDENTELIARYEWGDDDSLNDDLSVLSVGLNQYYGGHKAKATIDLGYALNGITANWHSNSAGYRPDSALEDGQVVLRTQFQLLF